MAEDTEQTNDLTEYRLPQGRMLRIQRAEGWQLHCDEGAIHLTQQDDARDTVLGAGGALVLTTNGRVVLDAHGDVRLRLVPPAAGGTGWRGLFATRKRTRPATRPLVRLLAARRHGAEPVSCAPLTYGEVFRSQPDGTRLLEALVARAHRDRSEMMASAFATGMAVVLRTLVCVGANGARVLKACFRLQLPSLAETFAARVFLRSRSWH